MAHRILAIDDSLTIRNFIQRSLPATDGWDLILARDGADGIAAAQREQPDLILLDFLLPDMKGDDVCRSLGERSDTARMPIVLMSSSASEMKRTESDFATVVRSIAKPFTPELLTATVRYVLRGAATAAKPASTLAPVPKKPAPLPNASGVLMLGDTAKFPLPRVLGAVAAEELTGVLRLISGEKPVEVWCLNGRVLAVTHRDASVYLRGYPERFTAAQIAAMDVAMRGQSDCGCPAFLSLADRGLLAPEQAEAACHWQGLRCFSTLWTAAKTRFDFVAHAALPDFCARLQPFAGEMDEWAMEGLRLVGDDALSAIAWGDLTGIPAFTRSGFERVSQLPLLEEEMQFAAEVNGAASLLEIAHAIRVPVEAAQLILYRFLVLEILDYWPESLLGRPA